MAKPTIRFKGYQDDWEQRKLGDIGKARSGVGFPDAEQGGVTGIPFFKVSDMNLDGNENEMTVANNYVTAEQIAVHRWSPITELPAIFFAKVGAAVMLNRKRLCRFPFLLDNNTMAYSLSSTKWDADFAKALFGTVDLTSLVQVGALPSYNARDVESMEIYLPSLLEQEQIGGFFKQLDTLITLHQRKCDETKRLKKYMLQKMFPQNGEKVPEIRFSGFTDDWEQRKLGDIGKARSGVGFPDAEQGGVTGIPFFKVSDMNLDGNENEMTVANNYVTAEQIAVHRWSPITELPAIFFAKVGAAVMLNRKRLCRFPFLLDNNTMAYSLSSTKWDADFAKALFGTVDLTSLVQVGALPSYNARDVESMEIYLPSLLEQEQIGGFFKQLDTLITLHQRELENLQNIKKFMLGKMFV
ncbi:MAG: restriction endonuclease subunit S [Lachnospiraceae bacterium]